MYKCGWQGCEKAYGTLNHLNAHVTMQSHGAKRTPEGESLSLSQCLLDRLVRAAARLSRALKKEADAFAVLEGSSENHRRRCRLPRSLWLSADILPPTEFKEIRKEWKQRKKDEENARKAEEERQRTANGGSEAQPPSDPNQPPGSNFQPGARPQLPPIGYAPAGNQVPQQYPSGVDQMYQPPQGNGQVYASYPHSPYQGQQM